jgi:hypothetical protein
MKNLIAKLAFGVALTAAASSQAAIIDFTGGKAYSSNGTVCNTTNTARCSGVDYYEEEGFIFDFIGANESVGNYYGNGNSVVHSHWNSGLKSMEIRKVGGGFFDLNYFILTSNTKNGGGAANGTEKTYVEAWKNGVMLEQVLLTPDSWGFVGVHNVSSPLQTDPKMFLSSKFDSVDVVKFKSASTVHGTPNHVHDAFCFGMDMFFIDEPAPGVPGVPAPLPLVLFGLGFAALFARMQRKSA